MVTYHPRRSAVLALARNICVRVLSVTCPLQLSALLGWSGEVPSDMSNERAPSPKG